VNETGCEERVAKVWADTISPANVRAVCSKIHQCGLSLSKWGREEFGNILHLLRIKRARLKSLEDSGINDGKERSDLQRSINGLLEKEEVLWKQRSCVGWLKHGDRNSRFFHAKATQRARHN
jgi:hypothetical protein